MSTFITVILSIWTGFYSFPEDHAVYISVVEFQGKELRLKLFTDDLQDAIRNDSQAFQSSDDQNFCRVNRTPIESYFRKKIKIKVNGRQISFRLRDSKLEGDSYWIAFDLDASEEWKTLSLTASHFMELFPTQTNIIKVIGSKQRFCKLTTSNRTCSISF